MAGRGRLATCKGDLARAIADIGESIRLAGGRRTRSGELAAARGYLYLNLALTFAGQHEEAAAAGETARERLTARGHRIGVIGLEAQLAYLHQLTGNVEAAIECCDRGLALLDASGTTGERWLSGYLFLISGIALAQCPGREHASAVALSRALTAKHELGDVVGMAYAVEAVAWLAARREQYERTAWLLGAADQLWDRTGRRLSAASPSWRNSASERSRPPARRSGNGASRPRTRTAPRSAWTPWSGTPRRTSAWRRRSAAAAR